MRQNRRTFLRNTALTGGALTLRGLVGTAQTAAGSEADSSGHALEAAEATMRQQFQSPASKYRPLVRWWWPGNNVSELELRREVDVLEKAGFGGAEIQAFFKGFNVHELSEAQIAQINSYASPSFFRHVRVAVEEARKHGMFIDYTFGSGWPFGGSEITPELAAVELRSSHLSVEGPAKFSRQVEIPSITDGNLLTGSDALKGLPEGWAERMMNRAKVVAVVAVRGEDTVGRPGQLEDGTSIDLASSLRPDGVLTWDVPPGTWQLFVFCRVPTGQRVNAGAGDGPQLVLDHMNSAAFQAHAKHVGDDAVPILGDLFGNGLRAVFCDSLEVRGNLYWSDDFLAEFRRRRNYDLLPYLPILRVRTYVEPFGEFVDIPIFDMAKIGDQVRHDYRQTVSDIMIERFYEPFNQWAHDHKLLSRTQAHGAPADVLRIYGETDIPETEDLYDGGCYDFLKMAASSANVYGRSIVGSESFVWPGVLYQTTPEKIKLAADELLTAGVNAILYHGFPYLVPEIPAPGWDPFSGMNGTGDYSSQINELNTFWPYLAQLNAYITRIQYISQTGTNIAAVALYRDNLAHGAEEAPPTPKLNQAMMDAGYNYDHINQDSLLHCSVHERMLVTSGGARYRALVLPPLDAIDAALAEMMQGFAAAGLAILFTGQVPQSADGLLNASHNTQRAQAAMRSLRDSHTVAFASDISELTDLLRKSVTPNIRFRSEALPFIQKRIGKTNAFFLRNPSDATQHLHAEFEAKGDPEQWNPWTGEVEPIASSQRKGDWVAIELDLQPMSSALIIFDPDRHTPLAAAPASALRSMHSEEIGANGWNLTATGLIPSGKTAVIHRDLARLIDWSLDSELRGLSGRGTYTTSFTVSAADAGNRLRLDLGEVKDVAEITVNGKHAATLLLRPYQADITDYVRPGENSLEITVTNALFNSMVLREPRPFHPGQTENSSGLMSAGLLGPVQLTQMR
jgi:hypothetical protein